MAHTSVVHLLKNVPLFPDYSDTLVFASVSVQSTYFLNKMVYSFTDLMYIRDNIIYIPNQAGNYRTCTYLMYTNPDYPNKWFYAFITSVEYTADGTTIIRYMDDLIQTWYFDFVFKPCFVQREHVNNDAIGANLKEENVALGDYVVSRYTEIPFTGWVAIVASATSMSSIATPAMAQILQGSISGLEWTPYPMTDDGLVELRTDLAALAEAGKSDAVVSIWAVPVFLLDSLASNNLNDELINNDPQEINIIEPLSIDGYTPKNNKLFTYPYSSFVIGTLTGQNVILRYEFFGEDKKVAYRGSPMPNGRIIFYPKNYAGVIENYDYSVQIGDYPQGSWTQDVYSNWLATQSVKWDYAEGDRAINTMFDTTMEATSGLAKLVGGNVSGGFESAGNMLSTYLNYEKNELLAERAIAGEKEIMRIIPPSVKGTIGSDATVNVFKKYGFKMYCKTITSNYAKSIDDYFSMFGYRVDEVKVPNIFGRQSWNYVQTIGAIIQGNAPLEAKNLMRQLMNRGIRFWHNTDVGNFSLSNNIVGGGT